MEEGLTTTKERVLNGIGYRVAGLGLWLDTGHSDLTLTMPPAHMQFIEEAASINHQDLTIQVRQVPGVEPLSYKKRLFKSETRELWLDQAGNYVLDALLHSPSFRVVIKPDFSKGEVFGDYPVSQEKEVFPLRYVDIIIYVNWLAKFHDVILHAAGVKLAGRGYCFLGPGGVGKSTLAAQLKKHPEAEILGEDQVILRYLDGRFWIFGTPWHANPEFCAPVGVPLERVFFLERNGITEVKSLSAPQGVARILQTAFIPYYRAEAIPGILERLSLLAEQIPFSTLSYTLGADVSQLIFNL